MASRGSLPYFEWGRLLKIVYVCVAWYMLGRVSVMVVSPVVFCLSHTSTVHVATKISNVRVSVCSLLMIHLMQGCTDGCHHVTSGIT